MNERINHTLAQTEKPLEGELLDRQSMDWELLSDLELRGEVRKIAFSCKDADEFRKILVEKMNLPWEQVEMSLLPSIGNMTAPNPETDSVYRPICFSDGQEINLGIRNAQGRFVLID
jgi:hypothetical protein